MVTPRLRTLIDRLRHQAAHAEQVCLTDRHLLERFVRHRDEAAFELLVWRHGPMVLGACGRVLRHDQAAEDAFQATFLTLVRRASSILRHEAVGSWLYRVAVRIALRARKQAAKRSARECPVPRLEVTAPTADGDRYELRPVLDEEIERLPEKYRAPVVLCYFEGLTNQEAAERLGCAEGTVASWLTRARERLRRRLTQRGLSPSGESLALLLAPAALAGMVPPLLVQTTMRASLAFAAGQTSVPGAISVSAAALAEGALRSMWFNKLKLTAVLVVIGFLGTGAGVLAFRAPAGTDDHTQPAKHSNQGEPPPVVREAPQHPQQQPPREESALLQLKASQNELRELEHLYQDMEARWFEQTITLRRESIIAEERLRGVERRHSRDRDREHTAIQAIQQRIKLAQDRREEAERRLFEASKVLTGDALAAQEQKTAVASEEAEMRLKRLSDEAEKLEVVGHKGDVDRTEELIKARLQLVVAEEQLNQAERRHASESGRLRARMQAVEERIQGLHGAPARSQPSTVRYEELERRLDQLLRELSDIRRQMRRQNGTEDRPPNSREAPFDGRSATGR